MNYDIKKDTEFEKKDDSVDELSQILQKQLSISNYSHLMRSHLTVMILYCEFGCGFKKLILNILLKIDFMTTSMFTIQYREFGVWFHQVRTTIIS